MRSGDATDDEERPADRRPTLARPFRRASRYDLLLAVIPAAFLLAGLLGVTLSLPFETVAALAGVVSALVIVDAFLDPPMGRVGG